MYNEELKNRFIQGYTDSINTRQSAVMLFNRFEKYENDWNADLCTRTRDELEPIMDNIVGVRGQSKVAMMTILKAYTKWCLRMGVPNARDEILQLEFLGLDKIRHQMVANPLQLQRCLNAMFEPESEETIDNTYRCYFWMAYGGVKEEDIVKIKNQDVDFQNMIIRYSNTSVPIYMEALPAFNNAVHLDNFLYKNLSYSDSIRRDRVDSEFIMRGMRAVPNTGTLRRYLYKKNIDAINEGKLNTRLTFMHVRLSGLFYRVYEMERSGVPADFSDAADQDMNGKSYYTKIEWKKKEIVRNYMEDYQRWKLAFST